MRKLALNQTIQDVKSSLYNREFLNAFDSDEKRVAYCCRWSPSRAVAYASVFASLKPLRKILQCQIYNEDEDSENDSESEQEDHDDDVVHRMSNLNIEQKDTNVLCIGGGAGGELVALASIFTPSRDFSAKYSTSKDKKTPANLNVSLVDIADWSIVLNRLEKALTENWLHDEAIHFNIDSSVNDVLSLTPKELNLGNLDMITLLFTTNELFLENKAGSIRFLQQLNAYCKPGAYLLILESAGSYSHIEIGSKKFPIQFLIDTVLLGKRGEQSSGAWELIGEEDSIWYRCDDKFDYALKLENMRFFYRLYKKK